VILPCKGLPNGDLGFFGDALGRPGSGTVKTPLLRERAEGEGFLRRWALPLINGDGAHYLVVKLSID